MTEADQRFDVLDAAALGTTLVVALAGGVALLAANLGVHSVPVVLGGVVLLLAVGALLARGRMAGVRISRPSQGWWMVLPALAIAAVLVFPGFRYAAGDKDPGIYVLHAQAISDSGELRIEKSALQLAGVFTQDDTTGTQWRGFEPAPGRSSIIPSFYHLWPSLLATAFDVVGFRALSVAVPLLAMLGVLLIFTLARRLVPSWVAGVSALLLATNMMQVWQARYPSTEVLAQVLFVGSLFAVVVAVQTRAVPFALVAGTLVTAGFLTRGEGVLLVMLTLLAAGVAVAADLHRRVAIWFAAGVVWPLPLAVYQAYVVAKGYSLNNGVPGARTLVAVLVLSAGLGVVGSWRGLGARQWDRLTGWVARPRVSWWIRVVVSSGAVVLFVIGGLRPLFGLAYGDRNGESIRTFDERSLHRLALFFGWPALVLMLIGFVWAVWAKWSALRSIVVASATAFLVLFLYKARNSPQMMWWGRRFIPSAVPAIVLLAAMALCAVVLLRPRWRRAGTVAVALVLAFTVVMQTMQSWGLRGHDEKGGTRGVALAVAATAGDRRGVYLWEDSACCLSPVLLFGSTTWLIGHADSAYLPDRHDDWGEFLHGVLDAAVPLDQPVYVVLDGSDPVPPWLPDSLSFTPVTRITGQIPVWEETTDYRPDEAFRWDYDLIVYEVRSTT
ncbi:MAG: hypothetical protein RL238_1294 [Actinomycetota bacterium]